MCRQLRMIPFVFLFFVETGLTATPMEYLVELKDLVESTEQLNNMEQKYKLFKNFQAKQLRKINDLQGKDRLQWGLAHEHLTPIEFQLEKQKKLDQKSCEELEQQLTFEAKVIQRKPEKLPKVTQLALALTKLLCPSAKSK